MSEIKVGEYIRSKFGIRKVENITIEPEVDIGIGIMPEVTAYWVNLHTYIEEQDITKHSPNIIDLIELGDIVNRSEVVGIKEIDGVKYLYVDTQIYHDQRLTEDEIVSVMTHEQFAEMEYKV